MTITGRHGLVIIELSLEEAQAAMVDHGEMELILPIEDNLETLTELSDAIAEAREG